MYKKIKKEINKIPKRFMAFAMIFAMLFSYIVPITNVKATSYGDDCENYLSVNITNNLGFTIDSLTVNTYPWTNSSDQFHSNTDQYHLVLTVSENQTTGDITPRISYGGNWSSYITETSAYHNGNTHEFVLDINDNTHQGFLDITLLEDNGSVEDPQEGFDGKAYVLWSCGTGTCYHYFDNLPSFAEDGNSTYILNTTITADNNNSIVFDVGAQYKAWALKDRFDQLVEVYKAKYNTNTVDWTNVNPAGIIGEPPDMRQWEQAAEDAGACTKVNTPQDVFEQCVNEYYYENSGELPFIRLQPVGEPNENNAFVSYGDRNFKVVIYNSSFKGITMGNLDELNYYPSSWANPYIKRDHFDISGTSKNNPTGVDSVLLESTVIIRPLNYNSFGISSIEALDVPDEAVTITQNNGDYYLVFSSNFYDLVTFKVTDNNNQTSYFQVKRTTIDGWIGRKNDHPVLIADFYFDRERSYEDFDLTAKILRKDGTTRNVTLTAQFGVDDGMGNITDDYESDEEHPVYGPAGKGLKKSTFTVQLEDDEDEFGVIDIYLNAEYKGSTVSNYAGAYVGSGEGTLANIYHPEEEQN